MEVKFSDKNDGYVYKIAKTVVDGKLFTYYTSYDNSDYGAEIYSGPNYVEPFDSKKRSYSRNYKKLKNVPEKYKKIIIKLQFEHQNHFHEVNEGAVFQ